MKVVSGGWVRSRLSRAWWGGRRRRRGWTPRRLVELVPADQQRVDLADVVAGRAMRPARGDPLAHPAQVLAPRQRLELVAVELDPVTAPTPQGHDVEGDLLHPRDDPVRRSAAGLTLLVVELVPRAPQTVTRARASQVVLVDRAGQLLADAALHDGGRAGPVQEREHREPGERHTRLAIGRDERAEAGVGVGADDDRH